ncbi:hypothetical protein TERTU_1296 [Teredinibacter turnerae T7901]|uniref:Uncharacterized protein n=1 Tax=Teredinibacter turnerae (strain ATCC 39867 / T7901) TaxID=377629 RepID=C5BRX7_TERTT|nr:hypothetical protein TERTU_1296 [Teredinibacter turnerae T7901]
MNTIAESTIIQRKILLFIDYNKQLNNFTIDHEARAAHIEVEAPLKESKKFGFYF